VRVMICKSTYKRDVKTCKEFSPFIFFLSYTDNYNGDNVQVKSSGNNNKMALTGTPTKNPTLVYDRTPTRTDVADNNCWHYIFNKRFDL
jgi:hypothetical protein